MKKMGKEELAAILAEHAKWIADSTTGCRAEIVDYEISGENLPYGVVLRSCTISGGTVIGCTISDCTVSGCTISDCTVSGGTVSGGTISGGTIIGCTIIGGTVSGGTVSGGTVSGGKVSYCTISDCTVSGGTVSGCTISDCTVSGCTISDCTVSGGTVSGGTIREKKVITLRGWEGLYLYNVWAVLFEDGTRWVRMGCLFKSLEEWEAIGGIRKSNLSEFPDDGSEESERRARAFEYAKQEALALK